MRSRIILLVSLSLALVFPAPLFAQESQSERQEQDPSFKEGLAGRELSEKERRRRERRLRKETEQHFKKWLEEDAGYIITREERDVFKDLGTDEEREQFIETFWQMRDPTPDTIENEYKEEHYRRIAYANEKWSVGRPGWKSDRGRTYILFGPPDNLDSKPAGSLYADDSEGRRSRTRVTYAFETWFYGHLDGIGQGIEIEFFDRNGDGDYRLLLDPTEKEVFSSPGPLTRATEPLLGVQSGEQDQTADADTTRFDLLQRMNLYATMHRAPKVKFKDLEELVRTRISFNLLPFDVRTDFVRITDSSVLVPITVAIEKKDLTFQMAGGIHQATVNVFGRFSNLSGRILQTFEDVIQLDVPPALFDATMSQSAIYQKSIPLAPGLYKLNIVLKDLNSGNVGTLESRLAVPRFEEDRLAHSSLILAESLERAPLRQVGLGQFVIGDTKIRPSVGEKFRQNQRMGIYLQIYNLGIDEATNKPRVSIDYTIVNGDKVVFQHSETTADLDRPGQQITLEKLLPLKSFEPGKYRLNIKITDQIRQQHLEPSVDFRILP